MMLNKLDKISVLMLFKFLWRLMNTKKIPDSDCPWEEQRRQELIWVTRHGEDFPHRFR